MDAVTQLGKKNSKLANFVKYDAALSRDQQIDLGRLASLGNTEEINISSGVVLREYGPEKTQNTKQDPEDKELHDTLDGITNTHLSNLDRLFIKK